VAAESLDGSEIESADAVNYCLVQCHAGSSPFFPLELCIIEQIDDRHFLLIGAVDGELSEDRAGSGRNTGSFCCCGGDDAARVAVTFSIISDKRVSAAQVEGAAHALGCSGQSFLPIQKMDPGMQIIREGRLKDGQRQIHLDSDEDGKGGGGIP
jgi:hypothetical protein